MEDVSKTMNVTKQPVANCIYAAEGSDDPVVSVAPLHVPNVFVALSERDCVALHKWLGEIINARGFTP